MVLRSSKSSKVLYTLYNILNKLKLDIIINFYILTFVTLQSTLYNTYSLSIFFNFKNQIGFIIMYIDYVQSHANWEGK